MIAAFDDGKDLHIIKWTGRIRLHAGALSYCGKEHDAAGGVYQIPENVFTTGASFSVEPGQRRAACGRCRVAAQAAIS